MGRFSSRKNSASKKVSKDSNEETSDVTWSGEAWICSKQLKHYPAFCRSDAEINAFSFVYVLSPNKRKDNIAYVQDLYENEKGEKIVSARWFNFPEETTLQKSETHSREVLITATEEDVSAECINGIATVLTPYHFEECLKTLPEDLYSENFLCYREDRNGCIMPFSLSELHGYDTQPIFCNKPKTSSGSCKPTVKVYERTKRSNDKGMMIESSKEAVDPKFVVPKPVHMFFKVNDNIEFLSQDSGIRGCWFRCKVLRSSPKRLKVLHHDVMDDDGPAKLEEWVPGQRVANPDKFGMRYPGRLTVRPWPCDDPSGDKFEFGGAVDAWDSDRWWEGVVIGFLPEDKFTVFCPGENMFLTVERKHLRVSKDWVDGKWMSINPKADILSSISAIFNPMPKPLPPPQDAERKLTNPSKTVDPKCVEELNLKKQLAVKNNGGASSSGKAASENERAVNC